MDIFDGPCYKCQKYLLALVGQWPYETSSGSTARSVFVLIMMLSFLLTQCAKIIVHRRNVDTVIVTVPTILTVLGMIVKYLTCWVHRNKFKDLLSRIPHEWRTLTRKDEIDIMGAYAERGKFLSLLYIWMIYGILFLFVGVQVAPELVNIFTPFNVSRFSKMPYAGEYFVDPDKYFSYILLHMDVGISTGITAVLAADTIYIVIVLQACGMFGVICYRLEHLFDEKEKEKEICQTKKIADVVQYHWQILEYVRLINSCYALSFVIQFFLVVGVLSVRLVHASMILISRSNKDEMGMCIINICGLFLVVFLDIIPGQMLLDCKTVMYDKVYNNQWYNAPTKMQMSLILIMHMCLRPGGINVANIFISSFQIFATIVESSTSYFMVLYSLQ